MGKGRDKRIGARLAYAATRKQLGQQPGRHRKVDRPVRDTPPPKPTAGARSPRPNPAAQQLEAKREATRQQVAYLLELAAERQATQ